MPRRSIRFRLTVWYAAVLTGGLALCGGSLWFTLRHQLLAGIDRDLEGRASRLESYFRNESAESGVDLRDELDEFSQALPPSSYVILRGDNGFAFDFPKDAVGAASQLRMTQRRFALNGVTYDLDVGAPITDVLHVLRELRFLLWSLIPVVIAIACLGGAWLSGRALKPVQDVTAAAVMIGIENLSGRVPVPSSGDEIARLAEVLNSMLGRLESAVTTLAQFVANASHELRTPLAVIRTTAELALRRGRSPESYRGSLQDVVAETQRMTELVEHLLILARSDAEIVEMPKSPVEVRDIVSEVCTEMNGLAENGGVRLKSELGEAAAVISGNHPALRRLFVALLDNAIKHSHPASEVLVTVECNDARIVVTFRDFGAGIAEKDLPHIFERFYRADSARAGEGHGLGLPLAESIANAHGAKLEVASAEGAGSRFSVAFPARTQFADPAQPVPHGALART